MSKDKEDERRTIGLLTGKGFKCKRFSKSERESKQTPDFSVFMGSELVFYCEVKTIIEDNWIYNLVKAAPEGIIVGGSRQDPTLNRITTKNHEAVLQFNSDNNKDEHPNVLVFVNHDKHCRWLSLCEALTGFFFTKEGEQHPIFRRYSEGRIKKDKMKIDLYIWDDDFRGVNYLFIRRNPKHLTDLCRYFATSPAEIKDIVK
jgi:hypothetical protein